MTNNPRRAGLLGAPPTYRHGLQSTLPEHGWTVHSLDGEHAADGAANELDILIVHEEPGDTERIRAAAEQHDTVVALVADPIAEDHVACVRAGATAVADANGEPETIAAALDAVATDQVLVPTTAFQRLVAIARSHDQVHLAQAEIDWLRQLAAGDAVRDLAKTASWSDRAMHRALSALYRRIGVDNRHQAVAWAARHDLLGDHASPP